MILSRLPYQTPVWTSSLQAEVFAILTALEFAQTTTTDRLIISNSLPSPLALNTVRPECRKLVSEDRYVCITGKGTEVTLSWSPSHIL